MAFYNGGVAYANQDALVTAMDAWLVAEGWTQNLLDTVLNRAAWNKSGVFASMTWDTTDMLLYQALGYDGSVPGANPNDSGSSHRVRNIGNGAGTLHAFSNNNAAPVGPTFAHFVIEYTAGFYRHYTFGNLLKNGGYVGGEYCAGHEWDQNLSNIDVPNSASHSVLLDGRYNISAQAATVHIEGFPNVASLRWAVGTRGAPGTDVAANGRYRFLGGSRQGPFVQNFGFTPGTPTSAFVPGSPIGIFAHDPTSGNFAQGTENPPTFITATPAEIYWLGEMPLCYVGNMVNFTPGQTRTFGAETWIVFPMVSQAFTQGANVEQSGNAGLWYRTA